MAEPTSTATTVGLYALFITVFGVAAGEYALIIFAALAGSLWAVGSVRTSTKGSAVWLLLKILVMAVVLSGGMANVIESKFGWPVKQAIAPVAFLIGFLGNRWHSFLDRLLERVFPLPYDRRY